MWDELGISSGTAVIVLTALYFIIKWAVKNGIKEASNDLNMNTNKSNTLSLVLSESVGTRLIFKFRKFDIEYPDCKLEADLIGVDTDWIKIAYQNKNGVLTTKLYRIGAIEAAEAVSQ